MRRGGGKATEGKREEREEEGRWKCGQDRRLERATVVVQR